ncbi:MAG: YkgJ family cysteine cluster protein [Oscillatoriaceae bacterium SKYG93]|nr:YkgJ family cysteine cluster protein [Oscillatoriaceae bacterium SKYG93]MDW8454473.1 YkgJ family cysteine cluster protein [Oscillatoriaceae cyanobacterium SKYGB_i_bin93]
MLAAISQLAEKVFLLYRQIDEQTAALQAATGLQCPSGCGQCCENPDVEATPLEVLPLALELFRRGEALMWLERLEESGNSICVFYRPDPVIKGNGRCSMYSWRPTICRLFGFATVKNKQGQLELAACIRHKQIMPEVVCQTQEAIANGFLAPNFSDFSIAIAAIDPYLGRARMSINQAVAMAIKRVGLMFQLAESADTETGEGVQG